MLRINSKSKKIEDIIQDYIDYCNLRPKTIKSYYQTLMLFAKYIEEEMNITDIIKIDKEVNRKIGNLNSRELTQIVKKIYDVIRSNESNSDKSVVINNEFNVETKTNFEANVENLLKKDLKKLNRDFN